MKYFISISVVGENAKAPRVPGALFKQGKNVKLTYNIASFGGVVECYSYF